MARRRKRRAGDDGLKRFDFRRWNTRRRQPRSSARRNTDADMKKNLEAQGMVPSGGPPAKFAERIRKDYDRWTKVVKEAGIKPE
jgi:hypothetical protein